MLFLTILYHPHVTLFTAWDVLIIPAMLFPNGMDIFVVCHLREWRHQENRNFLKLLKVGLSYLK